MKIEDIFSLLEKEVAPVSLSDEFCGKYKMYDNSGIIINCGNEVTGALFSLDLTVKAVERAKTLGFNLIVTHHPAIYGGISKFDLTADPQAQALAECMKNGISVISMHLNFDGAPQGIDRFLCRGLGGDKAEISAPLSNGGYGRVYPVAPTDFKNFVQNVKKEFSTDRVLAYGEDNKKVSRVASFCGAGCDEHNIDFAVNGKADVFVSADMKHHEILALTQRGIAVIVLTHYASENYGFEKIYLNIKDGLKVKSEYFTDASLL
ncbi:MAG: Nif3-like dinuclear metal center hexameric protein [Clostridia bacterium]|nr:Nif3-like dinuclear metal center hexameric protein [Clostridia bacterium]